MATVLQISAILVALAGFACFLAGDWKLAAGAAVLFGILAWAWKAQPSSK